MVYGSRANLHGKVAIKQPRHNFQVATHRSVNWGAATAVQRCVDHSNSASQSVSGVEWSPQTRSFMYVNLSPFCVTTLTRSNILSGFSLQMIAIIEPELLGWPGNELSDIKNWVLCSCVLGF